MTKKIPDLTDRELQEEIAECLNAMDSKLKEVVRLNTIQLGAFKELINLEKARLGAILQMSSDNSPIVKPGG